MSNIKTSTLPDGSVVRRAGHSTIYRKYGRYHREDGPAYHSNYGDVWWRNGEMHRTDGPARSLENSEPEYFIKGIEVPPFEDISDVIPFNTETADEFFPIERIVNMEYYVISLQGQGDHEIKLVRQDGWDSLETYIITPEMHEDFKAAYNTTDAGELEEFYSSLASSNSSSKENDIALNLPPARHNGEVLQFHSLMKYSKFIRSNPEIIIVDEYEGYIY